MAPLRIYLDVNVLITAYETDDAVSDGVWQLLDAADRADALTLVTSELSLAEILVKPIKDQDHALMETYLDLLDAPKPIQTVPVSRSVLVEAARLRAASGKTSGARLVLPDFVHAATASLERCDLVLTADMRFPTPLAIEVLDLSLVSLQSIQARLP